MPVEYEKFCYWYNLLKTVYFSQPYCITILNMAQKQVFEDHDGVEYYFDEEDQLDDYYDEKTMERLDLPYNDSNYIYYDAVVRWEEQEVVENGIRYRVVIDKQTDEKFYYKC